MGQRRDFAGWFATRLSFLQKQEHAWRAFRHPNYRRYFLGQAVSILGNWIQQVALGWLVYRLSGSATLLGATAFLAQAPQLVVAPLAGVVIDRSDIRRLMLAVQGAMLLQAVFLAAVTYGGWIKTWHILLAALVFGILNSFDVPLRHAYTSQLVTVRADLPNAVALNSLFFNTARFIGPPLAGVVLALTSEAACFALNGISFLVIMAVLWRIRTAAAPHSSASFKEAMAEGVAFVRRSYPVRHILWQVALLNFLAANYVPLMPAFARDVFHGGPDTLGLLLGAAGAGAMLFIVGFGLINGNASSNTILQSILPENLRGRVLAVYSAANLGAAALGGLLSGVLADCIGPGPTLLLFGFVLLGAALYFRLTLERFRMHLRPLYAALGIRRPTPTGKEGEK